MGVTNVFLSDSNKRKLVENKPPRTWRFGRYVFLKFESLEILCFAIFLELEVLCMENNPKTKIDRVFEFAKKNQVTFVNQSQKPYKVNNSHSTWTNYANDMKTFEKWLQEVHGLKDITRAKPKHGVDYMQQMMVKHERKERGGSAFTLSRFPHALHALQSLARESGVYKGLKLGSKQVLLDMKNAAGITRKSDESTCLKANSQDFKKVQYEILNSKSPQKQLVAEIQQIQRGIGCRIEEALKLKKEHITYHKDGLATIYIKGKGGLERWVKVNDEQTIDLIKAKTEGKKGGAPVFQIKDRQGNDKSIKQAKNLVQEVVRGAAGRAGIARNGANYSSHSARKVFAQERMNKYSKMSYKQLDKILAKVIHEYPSQENGVNKLKQKKDNELQQIRNKIDPKGKLYSREERNKKRNARKFNHKELCLFLVSIDTGHFRCNIIRYYADYPSYNKNR